jgi:hypothetical protein
MGATEQVGGTGETETEQEPAREADISVDMGQAPDDASEGSRDGKNGEVGVEVEIQQGRAQRRRRGWEERQRQAEECMEVEEFKAILRMWSVGCPWCRATGEAEEVYSGHGLDCCDEPEADGIREMAERVKQVVRWERYSCCFDCGVPQEICARYEMKGAAGGFRRVAGGACQYGGVLIPTMVSMWGAAEELGSRRLYEWMRGQGAQIDEDDMDGWLRWMGRKVRWGGVESNEMCRAVVRLSRLQEEEER